MIIRRRVILFGPVQVLCCNVGSETEVVHGSMSLSLV